MESTTWIWILASCVIILLGSTIASWSFGYKKGVSETSIKAYAFLDDVLKGLPTSKLKEVLGLCEKRVN